MYKSYYDPTYKKWINITSDICDRNFKCDGIQKGNSGSQFNQVDRIMIVYNPIFNIQFTWLYYLAGGDISFRYFR